MSISPWPFAEFWINHPGSSILILILIGMMGAGKTTVGRELARRHGLRFVDCDHEIEARCGVGIPTIFEIEGEEGFRRRETQTLDALTMESGLVLATGGGAVLCAENREMMRTRGTVVYLNVPPQILWERTRNDRNRPLLQVPDPRARIQALHRLRDPLYRETAHLVVDGGRSNPQSMVRALERALAGREGFGPCCAPGRGPAMAEGPPASGADGKA